MVDFHFLNTVSKILQHKNTRKNGKRIHTAAGRYSRDKSPR